MSLVSCTAVPSGLNAATSAHLRRPDFPYLVAATALPDSGR